MFDEDLIHLQSEKSSAYLEPGGGRGMSLHDLIVVVGGAEGARGLLG